jgi:hypothetical protein
VGISNPKRKAPPKVVTLGDKKPASGRATNSHAPDAVSAEYRGKITICKKYFALQLSFRAKFKHLSPLS